ncbi:hypothetical protein [Oceanicaulis sp. UBA2681]|uniref:hypothetical protein n=1 Tax=Oceanicaulis sp. UBA2681 TaxID=1947007 RepID=UPI000EE93A7A|nr:hypothetical protein [Oceanicaulis sp. UBA2681]HCR67273.1 hypothetical protein [Oceanicaulis sp.]|tara:strand:- start:4053 stop:4472 length:420 start_codon:yes stop_codon:yes gene_type:complete
MLQRLIPIFALFLLYEAVIASGFGLSSLTLGSATSLNPDALIVWQIAGLLQFVCGVLLALGFLAVRLLGGGGGLTSQLASAIWSVLCVCVVALTPAVHTSVLWPQIIAGIVGPLAAYALFWKLVGRDASKQGGIVSAKG